MLNDWRKLDWLSGKRIQVDTPQRVIEGVASGVADNGALLVQVADRTEQVVAGSIRVIEDGATAQ